MKTDELFRIWDRFDSSDASELVFETEDGRIQLKRNADVSGSREEGQSRLKQNAALLMKKDPAGQKPENEHVRAVKAPLVGTFYRAPGPGQKPFVRPGQKVRKGDTLGIIEAMKMMNEITAPCDGPIVSILVEDETLVQFDQCLMTIGEEDV